MRFASLGSGSRGNAALVQAGRTCVLVDCGFSVRETVVRLERLGVAPEAIAAILVTHEHNDHVSGVGPFARRFGTPVWMTQGTWTRFTGGELPQVRLFNCHEPFAVGDLAVEPFPVPHDAREPCQFVFGDGAVRLGVLTDVGRATQHIEACLDRCEALLLECNHDPHLLATGPYPPSLQARVAGALGHLSNGQAAALLARIDQARLQHVVAAHLSEKNNRPALAQQALAGALGCGADWIGLASQDEGFGWREIA